METYVPLQQQAYDYIIDRIHRGELERGKIYSEKKIAADMNISRTPVRDAILRLSQDRYLDIVPSKGFQLHVMTEKDIQDAYEVRTAIEGFCAVELHTHRNEPEGKEAIRQIKEELKAMKDTVDLAAVHSNGHSIDGSGRAKADPDKENQGKQSSVRTDSAGADSGEILDHDFAFHRTIVRAGNNRDFIRLFESYYHMLLDIADMSFEDPARPQKAYEEHEEIYRNLISNEEDAEVRLYQSVMNHMKASRDIALRDIRDRQQAAVIL